MWANAWIVHIRCIEVVARGIHDLTTFRLLSSEDPPELSRKSIVYLEFTSSSASSCDRIRPGNC